MCFTPWGDCLSQFWQESVVLMGQWQKNWQRAGGNGPGLQLMQRNLIFYLQINSLLQHFFFACTWNVASKYLKHSRVKFTLSYRRRGPSPLLLVTKLTKSPKTRCDFPTVEHERAERIGSALRVHGHQRQAAWSLLAALPVPLLLSLISLITDAQLAS